MRPLCEHKYMQEHQEANVKYQGVMKVYKINGLTAEQDFVAAIIRYGITKSGSGWLNSYAGRYYCDMLSLSQSAVMRLAAYPHRQNSGSTGAKPPIIPHHVTYPDVVAATSWSRVA